MTATITLQPEDYAEMIAQAIGDGFAWLIRWTLVLLILLTRNVVTLTALVARWGWSVALPTVGRWLVILALLLAFCVRLTVALAVNTFRWWKYRYLKTHDDQGEPFIIVEYAAVTM